MWVYVICEHFACNDTIFTTVILEIGGTQSAPIDSEFELDQGGFWYDVSLFGEEPFVEAGKQYEIKLSASGPGVRFGGAASDVYPGGEFSAWDGLDWST